MSFLHRWEPHAHPGTALLLRPKGLELSIGKDLLFRERVSVWKKLGRRVVRGPSPSGRPHRWPRPPCPYARLPGACKVGTVPTVSSVCVWGRPAAPTSSASRFEAVLGREGARHRAAGIGTGGTVDSPGACRALRRSGTSWTVAGCSSTGDAAGTARAASTASHARSLEAPMAVMVAAVATSS